MLDANIKTQLKAYLEKLVASLDDGPKSAETRGVRRSASAKWARLKMAHASVSPACRWAMNSPR